MSPVTARNISLVGGGAPSCRLSFSAGRCAVFLIDRNQSLCYVIKRNSCLHVPIMLPQISAPVNREAGRNFGESFMDFGQRLKSLRLERGIHRKSLALSSAYLLSQSGLGKRTQRNQQWTRCSLLDTHSTCQWTHLWVSMLGMYQIRVWYCPLQRNLC